MKPLRAVLTNKDAIRLHCGVRYMLDPQLIRLPVIVHDEAAKLAGINALLKEYGYQK